MNNIRFSAVTILAGVTSILLVLSGAASDVSANTIRPSGFDQNLVQLSSPRSDSSTPSAVTTEPAGNIPAVKSAARTPHNVSNRHHHRGVAGAPEAPVPAVPGAGNSVPDAGTSVILLVIAIGSLGALQKRPFPASRCLSS